MTRKARLGLGLVAGAVAALGHAPFGYWPVALLGFAGLAWLVAGANRPHRVGWVAGVGYFGVTLHWIVQPFLVDVTRHGWMAPFALFFLAAGLALFWGAAGWLSVRMAGNRAINWAIALTFAEIARGHVLTGFPWALPAYIWTDTPIRMTAALAGPYGLTLITLILTALVVADVKAPKPVVPLAAIAGFTALLFISNAELSTVSDGPSAEVKTVRLVQPNAPQQEKWDPEKAHIFVERQIGFTAQPKDGVDLIVWPESALPYWYRRAGPVIAQIAEAAEGVPVVFGLNRAEGSRAHNALAYLNAQGEVSELYDKVHLVPFGEYIPFGGLARVIGLQSFAARDGYGFSAGKNVRLIETGIGKALPLICYEAIFPGHLRKAGARPDYILQITNDAWFGTFSGPFQHLQQAQFRAAEQGLPLVRAANTGVSAVIGPDGTIVQSLPLGEKGYVDVDMPVARASTLYAQTGDLPVLVIVLLTIAALIAVKSRNTIALRWTSS